MSTPTGCSNPQTLPFSGLTYKVKSTTSYWNLLCPMAGNKHKVRAEEAYHPGHIHPGVDIILATTALGLLRKMVWEMMSPYRCSRGMLVSVCWSTRGLEGTDVLLQNWEREPGEGSKDLPDANK